MFLLPVCLPFFNFCLKVLFAFLTFYALLLEFLPVALGDDLAVEDVVDVSGGRVLDVAALRGLQLQHGQFVDEFGPLGLTLEDFLLNFEFLVLFTDGLLFCLDFFFNPRYMFLYFLLSLFK